MRKVYICPFCKTRKIRIVGERGKGWFATDGHCFKIFDAILKKTIIDVIKKNWTIMSNFYCEHCGTAIIDSPHGYLTECPHWPNEQPKVIVEQKEIKRKVKQRTK